MREMVTIKDVPRRLFRIRPVSTIIDEDGTEIDRLQRELDALAQPAI